MCGVVSTEFLHLTAGNFEHTLASDDVLAHYFNDFLSLPSFPETLLYNRETGLFEVVNGAANPTVLTTTPPADNHYIVCCLDREQGIQWIVEKRLPFFLQSDCYIEYRLAKLLFQRDPNPCVQRRKSRSSQTTLSASQLCSSQCDKENDNALQNISTKHESIKMYDLTYLRSGQKEHINTKCSESSRCFSSCSEPENPFSSLFSSCSSSSDLKCEKTQEVRGPQTQSCLCFMEPSAGYSGMQYLKESRCQNFESSELQLEYLAGRVVQQVLDNALSITHDHSWENISDRFSKSGDQTKCTSAEKSRECKVCQHSANGARERLEGKEGKVQEGTRGSGADEKTDWDKKNGVAQSRGADQENVPCMRCRGTRCQDKRPGLDEFKGFLRGTRGEKLVHLWMDIEKLKAIQHREWKNRHLVLMRRRYLLSSSQSNLNTELLSRLGLTTSPCWTEEKLSSVQPCLLEALLYYWVPRFWKSRCVQEDPNVGPWTEQWNTPLSGCHLQRDPLALPPLLSDTSLSPSSHTVHSQLYSSRGQLLGSRRMEKMLQALWADSRAGLYFTHFCVESGNQLWGNAVYFWSDLQLYHELFYQNGLDPYRVQREAQLLYATYLYMSARKSIGLDEEIRREVHDKLMPAFEELFDEAEEHTLSILLQPWTLLVRKDKESFQKVCVREELHRVESQECGELWSMYEESERRLKQVQQSGSMLSVSPTASSTPLPKGPPPPDSGSRMSPNYQGYRLGSLLRHRHEIGRFMSFLQSQDASIHLTCWLDLERYRRTQKDKAAKQERSSHIATKYLNRKYFFGPDSPASTEQQNDILHLAGGLERLKLDCLSNLVVVEIQDIVRSHIEKTWLPQFLSTAEFTERQKHKAELPAADRLSQQVYHRRRTRRAAWKQTEGLWMSSSKEILLFRQILLNPVTCMQFQHFVSLKGDFLENDLLFWLEVQRYKDLCHSHSDDATIQQKISTIISCFINSSMPPSLQIDIPPEQAQRILEKRHELGPYIFREAQMSVFSELLKFWPEFQELSSSVQEEQLLPLLQERRVKHRARVRRQRRKEEEEEEEEEEDERRRTQEEQETHESSCGEEDDADGDLDDAEEEKEGRSGKKPARTPPSPPQALSWSYSKYMAALKREEVLLRRRSQLDASFSTASDSSSYCRSAGSKSHGPSRCSARADSKQSNRYNRGVRGCNTK